MIAERIEALRRVDWWPFTRITITAAVLAATTHVSLGWQPPLRQLAVMPGQILGILSLMAMISFALADLYLLLFLIPLYVVGVLNDWFYLAPRWTVRFTFRCESRFTLGIAGLCGEVLLFGGLGLLLRHFASGSGLW
ncbi:MAG: hypothetical protein AABZ63_04785 [Actinomycetota bacterium]